MAEVDEVHKKWMHDWGRYVDLIYTRKSWLNDEYSGSKRANRVDRHWYYSGAKMAGTIKFRRSRKIWWVLPW